MCSIQQRTVRSPRPLRDRLVLLARCVRSGCSGAWGSFISLLYLIAIFRTRADAFEFFNIADTRDFVRRSSLLDSIKWLVKRMKSVDAEVEDLDSFLHDLEINVGGPSVSPLRGADADNTARATSNRSSTPPHPSSTPSSTPARSSRRANRAEDREHSASDTPTRDHGARRSQTSSRGRSVALAPRSTSRVASEPAGHSPSHGTHSARHPQAPTTSARARSNGQVAFIVFSDDRDQRVRTVVFPSASHPRHELPASSADRGVGYRTTRLYPDIPVDSRHTDAALATPPAPSSTHAQDLALPALSSTRTHAHAHGLVLPAPGDARAQHAQSAAVPVAEDTPINTSAPSLGDVVDTYIRTNYNDQYARHVYNARLRATCYADFERLLEGFATETEAEWMWQHTVYAVGSPVDRHAYY